MNVNNSDLTGVFIQGNVGGNIESHIKSEKNSHETGKDKTLVEAAIEIKKLLDYLESTYPTATESEKIAYVNDETTPSLKRRVVGALQAGGEVALEEILDNPYVNIGKAIIKGWVKGEA